MAQYRYQRLSARDASFLRSETANVHMHVSITAIFAAGPLATRQGGVDIEAIRHALEGSLHLAPRCRQKLAFTPCERHPIWIDDRDFQLDYHLRHTALPKPGSDEQLKNLAARIMSRPLDRARPLWEIWIVEGLQAGRFAMISKLHHCMAGSHDPVDLVHNLLAASGEDRPASDVPAFLPRPAPTAFELLRDDLLRHVARPFQLARAIPDLPGQVEDFASGLAVHARGLRERLDWLGSRGSESPLSGDLVPQRRFDWLTLPLGSVKAVRRAFDCTLNDLVLATVAGAVRAFLIRRHVRPDGCGFHVTVPVGVEPSTRRRKLGPRVSSWRLRLPVGEPDARQRLARIQSVTAELERSRHALPVEAILNEAQWTPSRLISLGARAVSDRAHMVVTNVPGPGHPLHLLGARLLAMHAQTSLAAGTGLAIAVVSTHDQLCWGFNADYELLPDLAAFRDGVAAAFHELELAAGVDPSDDLVAVGVGQRDAGASRLRTAPSAPRR